LTDERYPAILVHGWNSHPGVWKRLAGRLEAEGIPCRAFDHTGLNGRALPEISSFLGEYLHGVREETGWYGPVDMVCHSMGTCITRYLLEVEDGTSREHAVRQLIGLGPPNNGSALAELFNHPVHGEPVINRLRGVFVPEGFDPESDQSVRDARPESPVIQRLQNAGLRPDIMYRVIVGTNPEGIPGFFPWFGGRTWEIAEDGRFRATLEGDGVVAFRESALPGVLPDVLPAPRGEALSADQFCHINLPKNPLVIDRVLQYLKGREE
jgi:triacylglycerol lipase